MDSNKVIIISGGLAEDDFIKNNLNKTEYKTLICCDSGMGVLRRIGVKPDVILGDFDSVKSEDKLFFESQRGITWDTHPSVKNGTDTELACEYAINVCGAESIDLYGATGTRLDHVLGNLELLYMGYKENCNITILDSHNRISIMSPGDYSFKKEEFWGKFVSFVPFADSCTGVTLKGFKYEIEDFELVHGVSRGISNEVVSDNLEVIIKKGFLIKIESVD